MSNSITVLQAIKELSKVCDGAKVKDDNGFNAFDTSLKSYANYSSLTNEQQFKLKGKLEKYKTQLGIDEISIEVNENETQTIESQKAESTKEIKKSTRIVQGAIILYFDYSKNLVEAVKELPGRRFSATDKGWTIPISQSNLSEIKRFLDLYTFPYEEEKLSLNTSKNNQNRVEWDKEKGEVRLYFTYNPKIIDMFKDSIKWKTFNREDKYWTFQMTGNNAEVLKRITDKYDFDYDEESLKERDKALIMYQKGVEQMENNLEASKNYEAEIEVEGLKGTLRPFQKAGVKYIVENKRVIMGDDMGMGKTIQAIASVHKLNTYPALIICPNTLKYNWESEYLKWTNKRISIQNTGDKFQFNGDVLIINYNTAVKYQEELEKCNFNSMVIDESQNIKNKKAKRSKSIKEIQKSNNPELVLELTGTPIMNRPNELINQLELIDKLDAFGGFWEFAKRYCNAHRNRFGLDISGASNTEELHTKLRQLCYIRREKKDVLKELPDKQISVIELDIDNKKEYNKAENDIINYLKENSKEDDKFIRSIKDLNKKEKEEARKKYREEKGKSAEAAEHLVQINTLKQLSAKGKLKESIEWINEIVDSGEKIVVFAVHKEIIKQVQEKFKCNKIDGSVSAEDRQKYVEDFQSNPNSKVIVLNMKAGSVGLTLTAASKLCFLELAWTPGEHKQAEDRIHRIGQKNTADIYYLLARNTIDIDIYSLIKEKERITNMVNAGINEEGNDISIMNELIGKLSGNKERKMERELKGFMEKHGINSYQMGSHELKR